MRSKLKTLALAAVAAASAFLPQASWADLSALP